MEATFNQQEGQGPVDIRPYLIIKMKPGWSYDAKSRLFLAESGKRVSPRGQLPKYTRIVHMARDLAEKPLDILSKHELDLARYLQIILPRGTEPLDYIGIVRQWKCVEEVQPPREVRPA